MPPVYLILTSKPGQFHTEPGPSVRPLETYDYVAQGRTRACFMIVELLEETKICVIDEAVPPVVNTVPSKFFPRFETLERARHELARLANAGGAAEGRGRRLVRVP